MQYLPRMEIHGPTTLSEACSLAATIGEEAAFYAGGTELLLAMKMGALRYSHLIDLKSVPQLTGVTSDGSTVDVGAAVPYREILRSSLIRDKIPALAEVIEGIGNVRVRASGTLCGNLAFADPRSDVATIGLCLDAQCEITDVAGSRWAGVDATVLGAYETALAPSDVLARVRFPIQGDRVVRYQRFRVHERPIVTVAISARLANGIVSDARVVVGAATPVAVRCSEAEARLNGDTGAVAARANEIADAAVTSLEIDDDEEASAEYKRHLVRTIVGRLAEDLSNAGRISI